MSAEKVRFKGFEGLRVFAIAMVVAGHVGALQDTAGGIGNKIFFVLSGFLAYFSTVNISDIRSLLRFYVKKLIRIVPAYWLVILVAWRMFPGVFSLRDLGTDRSLVLNLFFIKTYGHLWFMQQIMLMYLCIPFLHFLVKWIRKLLIKHMNETVSDLLCGGIILIMALVEKKYLTAEVFTLSGAGSHAQFQIWIFLFGFAAAYLYEAWESVRRNKSMESSGKALGVFTDVYMAGFLFSLFFFVIPSCHAKYPYVAGIMDSEMLRTVLSCFAVLLLAITKETCVSKALGCPACKVLSDISFGIYMVHYFLLGNFLTDSRIQNFISNFLVSMCIAYFIFIFWEKPLTGIWKRCSLLKDRSVSTAGELKERI